MDTDNNLVAYSGSGRWTGVYIEKLDLKDENGKNLVIDTDIEITGKMPEGGRNPYLQTHNGVHPIFLGENGEFKIRTRYKTSYRPYIGIIDGQMGGWAVTLEISDIKVFKTKKEDSELDVVPAKLTIGDSYTSVLLGDNLKHELACPTGTFESMTFVNDSPSVIELNGSEAKTLASGTASFHVVNKYGIGQKYTYTVVDYVNVKPITSRKVLPKGKEVDYRVAVAPIYLTDSIVMTKPEQLVIENGKIHGTEVGDFDIKYSIERNGINMERIVKFKIIDNGETENNIYRMKKQNLQVGDTYTTDGYYFNGDGGKATYDIMTLEDYLTTRHEDVVKAKVEVDEYGSHTLDNGLVARIQDGVRLVEQYGAIGDGITDDVEPLIHLFGQTKTGEIRFGKDKTYSLYAHKNNEYASVLPQGIANSGGGKPTLGNIKDVLLEGNNSTILIPENEFACGTGEFGVINLLGEVDGLEIRNFTFLQNGLTQFTYLDDNAEVKSQMTRGHGISYTGGKSISNLNIHHNKFYECGTTINSNDCGGDFILIINPTASENVFIEDNEFYDWGRWVFSVDLGGSGERFYNYKFNRNICIQTVNNYLRYRADSATYRSLRGLGWIDFEARKCWTGLEVCDNVVEGACGFAINGNGKVTENVTVRGNKISRPDYNTYLTEEEKASGLTVGWRGVYNYGFNWYSMYGKDVLFEDNILDYGGITMVECYNYTVRNNVCAEWIGFGGMPIYGEIIIDGNIAPGGRSNVMNLNYNGTGSAYGLTEPYTHVVINNHKGGGFTSSQRQPLPQGHRPVTLEFTGDNHFNKMDMNVFGYANQVEFNPQWMNPDVNFAVRGAKFTVPTTRKYALSHNWQQYYLGFIGGGYYNEGEIVYQEEQCNYICTESGFFPSQPAFLLVDNHEIYYERATEQDKDVNTYIFTFDNWYLVTTKGKTGTVDNFPHHTKGSATWGTAVLKHLGHVGKAEKQINKDSGHNMKVVLDGDETYEKLSITDEYVSFSISKATMLNLYGFTLNSENSGTYAYETECDFLVWNTNTNNNKGNEGFAVNGDSTQHLQIRFKTERMANYTRDLNGLRQYLSENNMVFYLPRAKDEILPIAENLQNRVPYISTYYIKPTLKCYEKNILNFYVTDADDKAYLEGNDDYRYKVIITRDGKDDIILYNLKAGEHSVNLGYYAQEGEYEFSIIARDQYGRFSPEIFNFIRVSNGRVNKTYQVTEQDLIDYGIKYDNNREIKLLLDCSDIFVDYTDSNERIAKMKERTASAVAEYDLPDGHYVVAIPDREGTGVYKGKYRDGMYYQAVRYADGYDKEAVEAECNETRLAIQKLLNDKRAEGYNHVIMHKAVYTINANFTDKDTKKGQGIRVPNGMDLDLNGSTIKLNPHIGCSTIMIHIADSEDTHLHNGIIEGDYFAHDYTNSTNNSEWVCGVDMSGECKYCSIYDLEIKDITGYGLTNGLGQRGDYAYATHVKGTGTFTKGIDIDQTTGEEINNTNRSTSAFTQINTDTTKYKYTSCSRYLGYQGNGLGTWNMILHFYDKDKKYIKSTNAHKYHRVRVPDEAYYIRTTILYPIAPTNQSYQYFRVPTHCEFKNIHIDNARCVGCAPAQMKDILFENIEISNSGQCSANCALDAEDGWDGMQDVTFRNMIFHDNPQNNWLVCAGHNFIIEDSPNINVIYAWGRCKGLVIKNTVANSIYIENKGLLTTFVPRFYNVKSNSWNTPGILKDSTQTITNSILTPIKNCDLTITSSGNINGAKLQDSRVTLSNWTGYLNSVSYKNVDFYGADEGEIKFSMNYNGDKTGSIAAMYDCRFHHYTNFANHNGFCNGLFMRCEFNEGFTSGVKVMSQDELDKYTYNGHIYANCKFDKLKQFAQFSPFAYSSGQIKMTFDSCEFTFADDATRMFYAYSCVSNGSVITFRNCKFNNMEDVYLYVDYYNYDREGLDITFVFENCTGLTEKLLDPNKTNTKGQVKFQIK